MILVDTSGLLAALDEGQAHHEQALAALGSPHPPLLLSPFVLAELDYLLSTRVGEGAARSLLGALARGALSLERFGADEVAQAAEVIDRYVDLGLGLADASIVVLAERHGVLDLLTLDERHFRVVRGPGGKPFRLLPADTSS